MADIRGRMVRLHQALCPALLTLEPPHPTPRPGGQPPGAIHLAEEGRRVFEQELERALQFTGRALAGLDDDEQDHLRSTLPKGSSTGARLNPSAYGQ